MDDTLNQEDGAQDSLSARNRQAWDSLYQSTEQPVWGRDPAPFVQASLDEAALYLRPDARCLDAGTGEGRNLPDLLRLIPEVYACDASGSALAKIPTAIKERVTIQRCTLGKLPYASGFFDLVLSVDVLETLPDLEEVLREFWRVLRPGGLLVCNIPGEEDGIHGIEMAPVGMEAEGYLFKDAFFYRFLSEADARRILEGVGFQVISVKLHTWEEAPHPNFRSEPHEHTSRVFIAGRPAS